jgi:[acyl-carrier-protein] S-malonyltransferase
MFRIPMIFPGQASQAVGMARDLAAADGPGARFLAEVDDVLGHDLTSLMYEGPAETLTETWNAQPAILAHSVAVALELKDRGIEPSVAAGHSLGEFSAAVALGALQPPDGLRLVRKRGELMFAAGQERPGAMAAIMGLPAAEVSAVCKRVSETDGVVVLANHNSSAQIAISGEVNAIEAACSALKEAGAKRAMRLNVSGAFHSPLLDGAALSFSEHLDSVTIAEPSAPLIANVTAQPVGDGATLKDGFRRQLTSPVLWHDGLGAIANGAGAGEAPRVVLEVGPGKVLSNMAKREFPHITFIPVGTAADLDTVLDRLGELLA